jgi:fatty acid desaturase
MQINLQKYYKPELDNKILIELSKKSDLKGLVHVVLYFTLLSLTGYMAYFTWGTVWTVLWFLIYGNIYNFVNAIWHETSHNTAFNSKKLNSIFFHLSSFMAMFEPTRWKYTHFVHHRDTYSTKDPYDHEILYGNDLKNTPKLLLINCIPFADIFFIKGHISFEIIQHAFGIETKVLKESIPENAKKRSIFISRIYIFLWLLIILFSVIIKSWLPILFLLLPIFYGKTMHRLVAFAQHGGLARNVKDHRLSSRDMHLNPILSFLYWKMEYHCVHHIFPSVPSYNLDKLYKHLESQLPRAKNGLIDAYKDIIPALMKQKLDPNYSIQIKLDSNETVTA